MTGGALEAYNDKMYLLVVSELSRLELWPPPLTSSTTTLFNLSIDVPLENCIQFVSPFVYGMLRCRRMAYSPWAACAWWLDNLLKV